MRPLPEYEFSPDQEKALKQARILEWMTIAYLISVITLMYIVMGSSQTMKTAWIEDCLSLVPPIAFLLGTHICWRAPTEHYPYGFHRVISILFLYAALALLIMGGFLLMDSLIVLIRQEHPSIGLREYFGVDIWLGWWMILVLLWGTFPPVFLGLAKLKYAKTLNDKILHTDGMMNKADWMTALAAISGVLGIGLGWWWADAVAAALISLDILWDGWTQTKDAITGLMNRAPKAVDNGYLDIPDRARRELLTFPWIGDAQVRFYEHGHLIIGEGFIAPRGDGNIEPARIQEAIKKVEALDWRIRGFTLMVAKKI